MNKKIKYSPKRAAILACLQGSTAHPTAEDIFLALKPEIPDLSLGTVYRNLAQFCQDGTATCVGVFDGFERFDGNTTPHAHFVCSGCHAVIDIFQQELPCCAPKEVGVARECHIIYRGLCNSCIAHTQV